MSYGLALICWLVGKIITPLKSLCFAEVLERKIKEPRPKPTLSREYLIKELSRDAERLQNSPDCIKELLQKYIVTIDVFDDAIIIHSTANLSGALPAGGVKLPVNGKIAGSNSDDLNADGCGGRI